MKRGRAIEVGRWTDEQIEAERRRDRAAKARHFSPVAFRGASTDPARQPSIDRAPDGFWRSLRRRIAGNSE